MVLINAGNHCVRAVGQPPKQTWGLGVARNRDAASALFLKASPANTVEMHLARTCPMDTVSPKKGAKKCRQTSKTGFKRRNSGPLMALRGWKRP